MNVLATDRPRLWLLFVSLLFAASMWFYVQRVLVPFQVADALAHGRPRGNLSDLYPRWLGARELLLHGRDPYSVEVTREVQAGYYGRELSPDRPGDPRDRSAFAYPVYVAFVLAPTVGLPFEAVRQGFFWGLAILTGASVLLWMRLLGMPATRWTRVSLIILTLGNLPVVQALKLQQLTLLVAALVVLALTLLAADHPIASGVLLAISTIKPQLVCLLLLWLLLWSSADWRRRYKWAFSFAVTMAGLLVASETFLPHWFHRFWQATIDYREYTDSASVLSHLVGSPWGAILSLAAGLAAVLLCWRYRETPGGTDHFAWISASVLAVTVLVLPTSDPYNQVLLVPAALGLSRDRQAIWRAGRADRILLALDGFLVTWPWLSSTVLMLVSMLFPMEVVARGRILPSGTIFFVPVGVASLMLICGRREAFAAAIRRQQA